MSVCVVIPRSVPKSQARLVMREVRRVGFLCRPIRALAPQGWVRLEFLVTVESRDPRELEAFEIELDDLLHGLSTRGTFGRHKVQFTGKGVWIEPA
jgi:hypothetical protein